jgi:nucleoside phosphorylase
MRFNIQQEIAAQFDAAEWSHIVQFGKRLTDVRADVVVTMARKATCFIECLERLGLTAIGTHRTSDRVLDMDHGWLKSQRVILVDDALISGTTLYTTAELLKAAGAAAVGTQVLCVDREWWSKDLVQPSPPYLELDDRATVSLCAKIVDAIALMPLPYAVDFPLFADVRIREADFDALSSLPGWGCDDVSSPLQDAHGVFSLSLVPPDSVVGALDESFGWNLGAKSLNKLRIYGRRTRGEKVWMHMTPYVVLPALREDDVETLFKRLCRRVGNQADRFSAAFSSSTSRLRLVQYVAASRLARIWGTQLGEALGTTIGLREDDRMIGNLFAPTVAGVVRQLSRNDKPVFAGEEPIRAEVYRAHLADPARRTPRRFEDESDLWRLQARLTQPFLDLYRTKELAARALVKARGARAFSDPEYSSTLNRLKNGLTLSDLIARVDDPAIDRFATVSRFLDLAVDRGFVVPVTTVATGLVMRAFRHGEDILFSENEQRLCALAIQELVALTGRPTLPHLWVEKLLVLLVRIGLQRGFLKPWTGQMGTPGTAGIRYSLMGAVVQVETNRLYGYSLESGLAAILNDAGILARDPDHRDLYRLLRVPSSGGHSSAEPEARQIGALLGKALARGSSKRPILNDDDLIVLATCLSANDVAGALAAEMSIFSRKWRPAIGDFDAGNRREPFDSEKARQRLNELRRTNSYYAINSAATKYRAFKSGAPWDIVERVGSALDDVIYKTAWETYWPTAGRDVAASESGELRQLVDVEGRWCLEMNLYLRMLDVAVRYSAADALHESPFADNVFATALRDLHWFYEDLKSLVTAELAAVLSRTIEGIETRAKSYALRADRLRDFAVKQIRTLLGQVPAILEEVDAMVGTFGRPRSLARYEHVLCLRFDPGAPFGPTRQWLFQIVRSFQSRARNRGGKRHSPTLRFEVVPREAHLDLEGEFIVASGAFARVWLVRLAREVDRQLRSRGLRQILIFPHLPRHAQLIKPERTSQFVGTLFWTHARSVYSGLAVRRKPEVVIVAGDDEAAMGPVIEEVRNEFRATVAGTTEETLRLGDPAGTELSVRRFALAAGGANRQVEPNARPDIGLITILPVENIAVVERLQNNPDYVERTGKFTTRQYYLGTAHRADSGFHSIVCTQALEQGNRSIANTYYALLDEFAPRLVLLVGIAGGIHKKIKLCDVVAVNSIYYYDKRAERHSGTDHRLEAYDIDAWITARFNHFITKHGVPTEFAAAAESPSEKFTLLHGPIGSGEAVIKYKRTKTRDWLRKVNDQMLAVETEAAGLARAYREEDLQRHARTHGIFIFRGISDLADAKKEDRWQAPAAANATEAALQFLRHVPPLGSLLPRLSSTA